MIKSQQKKGLQSLNMVGDNSLLQFISISIVNRDRSRWSSINPCLIYSLMLDNDLILGIYGQFLSELLWGWCNFSDFLFIFCSSIWIYDQSWSSILYCGRYVLILIRSLYPMVGFTSFLHKCARSECILAGLNFQLAGLDCLWWDLGL